MRGHRRQARHEQAGWRGHADRIRSYCNCRDRYRQSGTSTAAHIDYAKFRDAATCPPLNSPPPVRGVASRLSYCQHVGGVMAGRWSELSQRQRRIIMAAALGETALKVAMLIDLKRRPADQVRGPKWLWASTALVNSAGILPVAYFIRGRSR